MRLAHLLTPAREPTAAERFRLALALAEEGLDIERARIRREHPDHDDEQVDDLLRAWLRNRPPPGDGCPGLRDAMYRFRDAVDR